MSGNKCRMVLTAALSCFLLLSGCASYAPSLVRLNPSGPNVRKAATGDLILYVEEYATSQKSERAFDTDLAAEGVLPLLIHVENNGQQPYEVKAMEIGVRSETLMKPLSPEETASRAGRSAVGRALGWSLIVPIISIPVAVAASAIHTSKVNQQIVHDFAAKGFPDGIVMPNKERSGFLFFQLEEGRKDLSGLNLEMTARNVTTGEAVRITTPLPEANFTQTSSQDESTESKNPSGE